MLKGTNKGWKIIGNMKSPTSSKIQRQINDKSQKFAPIATARQNYYFLPYLQTKHSNEKQQRQQQQNKNQNQNQLLSFLLDQHQQPKKIVNTVNRSKSIKSPRSRSSTQKIIKFTRSDVFHTPIIKNETSNEQLKRITQEKQKRKNQTLEQLKLQFDNFKQWVLEQLKRQQQCINLFIQQILRGFAEKSIKLSQNISMKSNQINLTKNLLVNPNELQKLNQFLNNPSIQQNQSYSSQKSKLRRMSSQIIVSDYSLGKLDSTPIQKVQFGKFFQTIDRIKKQMQQSSLIDKKQSRTTIIENEKHSSLKSIFTSLGTI